MVLNESHRTESYHRKWRKVPKSSNFWNETVRNKRWPVEISKRMKLNDRKSHRNTTKSASFSEVLCINHWFYTKRYIKMKLFIIDHVCLSTFHLSNFGYIQLYQTEFKLSHTICVSGTRWQCTAQTFVMLIRFRCL